MTGYLGGDADDAQGYFVKPTVVSTTDPEFDLMQRELFGPVVTAYVYDEKKFDDTLEVVNGMANPHSGSGSGVEWHEQAVSMFLI